MIKNINRWITVALYIFTAVSGLFGTPSTVCELMTVMEFRLYGIIFAILSVLLVVEMLGEE